MRAVWRVIAFLVVFPAAAAAQTASLVADRISIEADARLIAEGNVEVTYEGQRLTASRVVYDRETSTLDIEGPLVLTDGDGTAIVAAAAELDEALQRGILTSARLVLDNQLQLAAQELARVSGRYTRLSRVVASSCEICERGNAPLWEIRARRVLRDEAEQQLYFDAAQLRVGGVPVAYLPRLRLPDPGLRRSTGFLVPRIRTRSQLSTGLRWPYFIRLGDHADVTLTPYLSSQTRTLEFIYRQEVRNGSLRFEGAVSDDEIRPDGVRAYLFAQGRFFLPRDFRLRFDLELVSDESYLFDYGYSEKDRLDSAVALERYRADQAFRAQATVYETLRASEIERERELPNEILEFGLRQRIVHDPAFGSLWARAGAIGITRASDDPGPGRDVARFDFGLDWNASRTLPLGLVAEAEAELLHDIYFVDEDPQFDDQLSRTRGAAAVTLRWPLERRGARARHLLEPVVQLAWSDTAGDTVPNEDSTDVEFDEGNLLSLSRFPGSDAYEEGTRLNFGIGWTRFDPAGWSMGATVGRIYRFDSTDQFGTDTGLDGSTSDWLLALHYELGSALQVTSRSLLDSNLEVSRSETRFAWQTPDYGLSGTHLWRAAEITDEGLEDLSELKLDGRLRLNETGLADAEWRFDATDGETTRAALGLTFENECLRVGLSLSRRFTSSSNVEPATNFDLRVALTGLGTGGERRVARRSCRG